MAYTVLFPFVSTEVGGSDISAAMIADYLQNSLDWQARILLAAPGKKTELFCSRGIRPEYYNLSKSDIKNMLSARGAWGKATALPSFASSYTRALQVLSSQRPDLVHINDDTTIIPWGAAARQLKIPVIWHIRQEKGSPTLDRLRLHWSNALIFNSQGALGRFRQISRLPWHRVVYNSIDTEQFCPPASKLDEKIKQGLRTDCLVVGFVGNLAPRKRPEWIIQAALDLNTQGSHVQMVLVGDDFSRGYYTRLIEETRAVLPDPDQLVYLGYRRDVADLMKAFDVVAVPSYQESFGRIYAEAMATGIPALGCQVGGVSEVIKDGITGYVIPSDDYQSLVNRIKLMQDEALRNRMGSAGINHVQANFSLAATMGAITDIYNAIIDQNRRQS